MLERDTGPRPDVGPVFSALADPTRRHVVEALARGERVTPTVLAARLPISRQAVAKHLTALTEAGLVSPARAGREVRYALEPAAFAAAAEWMAEVGAEWDERLARLHRLLADPPRPPGP